MVGSLRNRCRQSGVRLRALGFRCTKKRLEPTLANIMRLRKSNVAGRRSKVTAKSRQSRCRVTSDTVSARRYTAVHDLYP
jgi:hypothetical protein